MSLVEAGDENTRRGSQQPPAVNNNVQKQAAQNQARHAPPTWNTAQQAFDTRAQAQVAPPHLPPAATIPQAPTPTFEDPAILSMGRKPIPVSRQASSGQWSATTAMERGDSSRTARGRNDSVIHDLNVSTTLVEPMKRVALAEVAASPLEFEELEAEVEQDGTPLENLGGAKKRPRKRRSRKPTDGASQDVDVVPTKETARSKGWRKTPLLEPNPSFQPFSSLKRQNKRGKQGIDEAGWATEDASEVQEMGDFDFERSLAKFDKRSVFQEIQTEDSIAEEDRLVSHNRLPKVKPGTAGGKNYHYTENVLDTPNGHGHGHGLTPKGTPKTKQETWKSEESETEDRGNLRDTGSGRQSRRADSKLAINRRPSSRKGSSAISGQQTRSLSVSQHISYRKILLTSYRLQLSHLLSLHSISFPRIDIAKLFPRYRCLILRTLPTMNLA